MATKKHVDTIDEILDSFELTLRAEKKSPRTITNYLGATKLFNDTIQEEDPGRHILDATRTDVARFISNQLDTLSSSTAATRFRCLQQFFRWLVREGYIETSPMEGMTPPALEEKVVPIIPDDHLRALLKTCSGRSFDDLRDKAIMLFMLDTGARSAETIGLGVDDVTVKAQEAIVAGKGDRSRRVYFSTATAVAIDRYQRERRRHSWAGSPKLWLGVRGPLTSSGLSQLLRRRGTAAGVGHLHPHMFRHTWAHLLKVGGMADDEVMELGGWRTPQMLGRYGSSARSERARANYGRIAPGDRL